MFRCFGDAGTNLGDVLDVKFEKIEEVTPSY